MDSQHVSVGGTKFRLAYYGHKTKTPNVVGLFRHRVCRDVSQDTTSGQQLYWSTHVRSYMPLLPSYFFLTKSLCTELRWAGGVPVYLSNWARSFIEQPGVQMASALAFQASGSNPGGVMDV
ncbi:hypothetical protein CDAR_319581 [Caerostris darwini]|uniref:Uncharacterized protein n=1 Tax=Caerostris darwini TaxID=1538125 RepID=A0AAV4VAE6_9ARAC|nr:hypothetical protein CDAR_319581 [Caerostris darwini]